MHLLQALRLYEGSDLRPELMAARVELACLDARAGVSPASQAQALADLLALLRPGLDAPSPEARAAAGATAGPLWAGVHASVLLLAQQRLASAGHPLATELLHELLRRLRAQWAQCPDDAARVQLVQGVPYWRTSAQLALAAGVADAADARLCLAAGVGPAVAAMGGTP